MGHAHATFEQALTLWGQLAFDLADARESYRIAHGDALGKSLAKNAEGRKAEADQQTASLRAKRNRLEIEERMAFHRMVHLRGGGAEGTVDAEEEV